MSLSKFLLPTITLIGIFYFTGCGESQDSTFTHTTLGEATSIINKDSNETMLPAPSTLKSITSKLAKVVELDVTNENQKDATSFTKETQYCDISGVREFEHQGDITKIKKLERFNRCKTTQYTQDGYLTFNYSKLDNDGKYPQSVNIIVNEDYTFDDILLKKGNRIDSQISYKKDKSIKTISINVNGVVTYQYGTYKLINDKESIEF